MASGDQTKIRTELRNGSVLPPVPGPSHMKPTRRSPRRGLMRLTTESLGRRQRCHPYVVLETAGWREPKTSSTTDRVTMTLRPRLSADVRLQLNYQLGDNPWLRIRFSRNGIKVTAATFAMPALPLTPCCFHPGGRRCLPCRAEMCCVLYSR